MININIKPVGIPGKVPTRWDLIGTTEDKRPFFIAHKNSLSGAEITRNAILEAIRVSLPSTLHKGS